MAAPAPVAEDRKNPEPILQLPATHAAPSWIVAIVLIMLTACSALPDSGGWGRSSTQRAPVESRDERARPPQAPASTTSAGIAQGEAAIATVLASLRANPEGVLRAEQTGYYMDVQLATLRKRFVDVDVTLAREGDQLRLVLPGSATFDSGSANLTGNARGLLGTVAEVLAEYDKTVVVIEGHSDARGAAGFNQALSEQRALAVARSLRDRGVSARRLVAVGYGPERPIADNDTDSGRALNRRVELLVRPVTGS